MILCDLHLSISGSLSVKHQGRGSGRAGAAVMTLEFAESVDRGDKILGGPNCVTIVNGVMRRSISRYPHQLAAS